MKTKIFFTSSFKKVSSRVLMCFLFFTFVFCSGLTAHAESSYTVTDMSATGTVGDSTLNVRSGPGKDYASIGTANAGETLTITGETDNNWYRIDYSGQEGFVSGKYVTVNATEASSATAGDPNDFSNYEEGSSQHDNIFTSSPKLLLLLAVIVVLVVIMVTTIIMIRKNDDDEEDEDFEDDDLEDEDDLEEDPEDDELENDEDEDAYEEEAYPVKKAHTAKSSHKKENIPAKQTSPQKQARKAAMITEEDYRLDIDPRIFEEVASVEATANEDDLKAKKLDEAMTKLEALQQEIEQLKNS